MYSSSLRPIKSRRRLVTLEQSDWDCRSRRARARMEGGGATLYAVTNMELRNTPSERKVRHSTRGCSEVERKRFAAEAEAKEYDGSDTDAKTLPKSRIVLYHDLLRRLWGWDRLVPLDNIYVPWTEYMNYLQVYYSYNAKLLPATAAAAETCLSKEKNLAAAWKIWRSDMDIIALSKSIILNCLIHECAQSVIWTAGCRFSDACSAALMCISKEADLTCELMWRGADPMVDYLFEQSSEIRLCALSLMRCHPCYTVAASAAMLGIAKEAQVMCDWMREENTRIDFVHGDFIPQILLDSRRIRRRTLEVMIKILEESSTDEHGGVNNIPFDFILRMCFSDVPNSQDQNTKEAEKSERGNAKGEYFWENLWGSERLIPPYSYVGWSDYINYLEKYYNHNALNFIDEAVANLNLKELLFYDHPLIRAWNFASKVHRCPAASVAIFCLMMEDKLMSEWKARVERSDPDGIFPVNTSIHSRLIKEHVISICDRLDRFSIHFAVVFVCLTMEADLMIELLKHGAAPGNDILEQSCVIRMCALGLLVNIKGHHQSIAAAAAMLGMAKEARAVHDWIKRENKLPTRTETRELGKAILIRTRTLDAMIDMLQASSFPSC